MSPKILISLWIFLKIFRMHLWCIMNKRKQTHSLMPALKRSRFAVIKSSNLNKPLFYNLAALLIQVNFDLPLTKSKRTERIQEERVRQSNVSGSLLRCQHVLPCFYSSPCLLFARAFQISNDFGGVESEKGECHTWAYRFTRTLIHVRRVFGLPGYCPMMFETGNNTFIGIFEPEKRKQNDIRLKFWWKTLCAEV